MKQNPTSKQPQIFQVVSFNFCTSEFLNLRTRDQKKRKNEIVIRGLEVEIIN